MRWFVSYRYIEQDFLMSNPPTIKIIPQYKAVVTNLTPAQWVREHTAAYHIQYAEKISPALASELVHGGAGVSAEYFNEEV